MEPKEKALELINKYLKIKNAIMIIVKEQVANNIAKQCALIAVEEILDNDCAYYNMLELENKSNITYLDSIEYWKEVKIELLKYK